jgi:hypothetical protein
MSSRDEARIERGTASGRKPRGRISCQGMCDVGRAWHAGTTPAGFDDAKRCFGGVSAVSKRLQRGHYSRRSLVACLANPLLGLDVSYFDRVSPLVDHGSTGGDLTHQRRPIVQLRQDLIGAIRIHTGDHAGDPDIAIVPKPIDVGGNAEQRHRQ